MANKKQQVIGDIKRIEWLQEMYREWIANGLESDLDENNDYYDEDYCDPDPTEPIFN